MGLGSSVIGAGAVENLPGFIEDVGFFLGGGDLFFVRFLVVASGTTDDGGCAGACGELGLVFLVAGEFDGDSVERSMVGPGSVSKSGLFISCMRLLISVCPFELGEW